MAQEGQQQSLMQRFMEAIGEMQSQQPSLIGQLEAMGREAAKDIRGKMMETFFNSPEVSTELGVPGNPTQVQANNDLGVSKDLQSFDATLENYASRGSVHGEDHDRGIEH